MGETVTENSSQRNLIRFKIWHIGLILLIVSILLYTARYLLSKIQGWCFLDLPLFTDIANACLTTLLIGFTYEWFIRAESKGQLVTTLEDVLIRRKKDISDALLEENLMRNLVSGPRLEKIIRDGIKIKVGNDQLGDDIYDGVLKNTLQYEDRWYNYRHVVTLNTINSSDLNINKKYYSAYINLRYETVLRKNAFKFICVKDIEAYNLSLKDSQYEFRWLFPPSKEYPIISDDVFKVLHFKVDNQVLDIKKTVKGKDILWIASHPDLVERVGQRVVISYQYEVKVEKRGHLLSLNVVCPTKGATYEIDYAATDIHWMNLIDSFVTSKVPSIRYTPNVKLAKKIEVEINEWVLPKGGVTFVWTLKPEMTQTFEKLM